MIFCNDRCLGLNVLVDITTRRRAFRDNQCRALDVVLGFVSLR